MQDSQIVGGPDWLTSDRFDIQSRANKEISWDETAAAVRAMLEDRFQLKTHSEMRQMPVYALTVGKNGAKMKSVDAPPPFGPSNAPPIPRGGAFASFKPLPGMIFRGNGTVIGSAIQIEQLVSVLSSLLDRPVLDKTYLKGHFDLRLQFAPEGGPAADPEDPSLFAAIQEQLGLRLESIKGPVEVVVIDSVQTPSEN